MHRAENARIGSADNPVDIFWTGGWDSTFRVIDLLIIQERSVRPFYIIDPRRRSTQHELRAIGDVRKALRQSHPAIGNRLADLQLSWQFEIPEFPVISQRYHDLTSRISLGKQFEWLANFAEFHELDGIELCLTDHESPHWGMVQKLMEPELVEDELGIRLRSPLEEEDLEIFRRFRFPLIHTTKVEMSRQAREKGVIEAMYLSWFCHQPTLRGRPCGNCTPCRLARDEGHETAPRSRPVALYTKRLIKRTIRRLKS